MPVETRYMRSDDWAVNTITAYKLLTVQTTKSASIMKTISGDRTFSLGVRVYKADETGVLTELTDGVVGVGAWRGTEGLQSVWWLCPETPLALTDAIYVDIYYRWGLLAWSRLAVDFITNQAQYWGTPAPAKLDNVYWIIYLYGKQTYNPFLDISWGYFYWGTLTYNSRIQDFTWSPVIVVVKREMGDGLVYADWYT